jgi:hypothetical protein
MNATTNRAALSSLANLDKLTHLADAELAAAKKNGRPGEVLACRNALRDLTSRRDALAARLGW